MRLAISLISKRSATARRSASVAGMTGPAGASVILSAGSMGLSGGKPRVALHGRVAQIARRLGVTRVELSLSHTGGMAYAMAVAVKDAAGSGEGVGTMVGPGAGDDTAAGPDPGSGHEEGEGG